MSKLKAEKLSLPKLTQQLNKLEQEHKKRLSFNTKKEISEKIEKLKEKISIIQSNQQLIAYETAANPLLEKYDDLKNEQFSTENVEKAIEKVVDTFLILAKQYISIQIIKNHKYKENACVDRGGS